MPSTREIVSEIQELAHGYNREPILALVNTVHRFMVAHDAEVNVILNTTTGTFPYLATTAGQRHYVMPDNYRKVAMIMIDNEDLTVDGTRYSEERYARLANIRERRYLEIIVETRPRTRNANATLTFPYDPTTTTTKFFVKAYQNPTEITGQGINLDIPDEYHHIVVDGVIARLRMQQYGMGDWNDWKQRVNEEYWQHANVNPTMDDLVPRRWA